jgi:hypothetical protein
MAKEMKQALLARPCQPRHLRTLLGGTHAAPMWIWHLNPPRTPAGPVSRPRGWLIRILSAPMEAQNLWVVFVFEIQRIRLQDDAHKTKRQANSIN